MLLTTLFTTVFLPLVAFAQDVALNQDHNVTSLRGTWSTTSGFVLTRSMIANPVSFAFNVPEQHTGASSASYSFTDDGFWEQCIYRLVSHGSSSCTKGVTIYQHGRYQVNSDGTITLSPYWQDGRIQVLDPCTSSDANQLSVVNQTEHISSWRIFDGPVLRLVGQYYTPTENMTRINEEPQLLTGVVSNIS
ncbi:Protein rot1 OS=Botryotinia fuckeliana (strain B05,10) GN=rot1 PE=3 SV=1 [Rhizoctonia solani AG-1 IB]|uniref:Protein rot1 n=1 Tax=Thanatephorus cucumeris (strain AG1-IB / isolate 7/3/14) TaxID=1108050 RepID=A0A0B7FFQ6_THACB|nr:Protein rot1 OS=Botryotinia fuckeliana (strain B05,10) GN=rot1 PE=3 SV=1 [Rhizoctonia solani AG-1 IB]